MNPVPVRPTLRPFVLCLLLCPVLAVPLRAQFFRDSDYWKTHRGELNLGLGVTNFLGELGGRDRIGAPFVWDLEFSQTKPALSFGYRYFIRERFSVRANLTYGVLAGSDNLTKEDYRNNRNLSFKSDLFEGQLVFEVHPFLEELGHMHDLRGVKGDKSSRVGLYFFAGIGGFYFDPKAQFNGEWVQLQPLNTEGQGLADGTPEPYSQMAICIPIGVGLRKAFTKNITGGLELQYTKTFTDYIDDVSGVYFDNTRLAELRGPQAAYLADPNLGLIPGQTVAGQQRGDPDDNDAYIFLKFTLHYKLYKFRTNNKKYRTRIRRQKVVF